MPRISRSKLINFPAERLFDTVIDIGSYPQILNFIQKVDILEKSESSMVVRVSVGLPLLSFSYDCKIEFRKAEYINITLVSGPFKKLTAHWKFDAIDSGHCNVSYSLDSEFSNPFMEITAGSIFASQIDQSIKAFEGLLKRS